MFLRTFSGLLLFASLHAEGASFFSCYQGLSNVSEKPITFAGKTAGIEYLTAFSFDLVTAEGVRRCTVPSNAVVGVGEVNNSGRFITVNVGKKKYYLHYGEGTEVVTDFKELPRDKFVQAPCDPPSNVEAIWRGVFERRISDKKTECGSDISGMGSDSSCLPHMIDVLKDCKSVGTKETATYFQEVLRSAEAQTAYKPGSDKAGKKQTTTTAK